MLLSKIFLGVGCGGLAGTCAAHGLTPFHHSLDLVIHAAVVAAAVAFSAQIGKRSTVLYSYFKQRWTT
jgi:hypothetical protein